MNDIAKFYLNLVLNLYFKTHEAIEACYDFLFKTHTSFFRYFNLATIVIWTLIIIVNPDVLELDTFSGFKAVGPEITITVGFFVAMTLILVEFVQTKKTMYFSGFALHVSALAWAVAASGFFAASPPFSPLIGTFFVLALACYVAGKMDIKESQKHSCATVKSNNAKNLTDKDDEKTNTGG